MELHRLANDEIAFPFRLRLRIDAWKQVQNTELQLLIWYIFCFSSLGWTASLLFIYIFFAFWSWEFDCEHLEKLTVHTSTETRNNKHITNEHAPKTQQWYCIFGITLTIFAYIRFARLCVLVCVCVWAHCVTYLLIYRPFVSKSGICG